MPTKSELAQQLDEAEDKILEVKKELKSTKKSIIYLSETLEKKDNLIKELNCKLIVINLLYQNASCFK